MFNFKHSALNYNYVYACLAKGCRLCPINGRKAETTEWELLRQRANDEKIGKILWTKVEFLQTVDNLLTKIGRNSNC